MQDVQTNNNKKFRSRRHLSTMSEVIGLAPRETATKLIYRQSKMTFPKTSEVNSLPLCSQRRKGSRQKMMHHMFPSVTTRGANEEAGYGLFKPWQCYTMARGNLLPSEECQKQTAEAEPPLTAHLELEMQSRLYRASTALRLSIILHTCAICI